MKNKIDPKQLKWLIDIFEPLEEVMKEKGHAPIETIMDIMEMVTDSLHKFKDRYSRKQTDTMERLAEISDLYIDALTQAVVNILREYAQDVSSAPYQVPKQDLDKIKSHFQIILKDDFKEILLVELFLNNFMMVHFPPIINSVKNFKLIEEAKLMQRNANKKQLVTKKNKN